MKKSLQILFLGLAIILSGNALAQSKTALHNARKARAAMIKRGTNQLKKQKKESLFTKNTTLFSEDFTNAPDTAWRNIDRDGDNFFWEYDAANQCMASWSYDTSSGDVIFPDNWLITPKIAIPANGEHFLEYGVFSYDDYWFDEVYGVFVSPSGSDNLDSFYVQLIEDTLVTDAYTRKQFSLNQFAGQQVRIAFVHHNCDDWWALGLDDVEVYRPDSVDLQLAFTDLLGTVTASNNGTFRAQVQNNGFANHSNLSVYCDVNGTQYTATIASLPSLQAGVATFSGVDFSSIGNYNVKIYVADPADADNSNDTLYATTMAVPAASITWDFEGDTNMPTGFTTAAYDGATAHSNDFFPNNEPWVVLDISEAIAYDELPAGIDGGDNVAVSQSWFDENSGYSKSAYPANRWMITPAIDLTTGNYLQWDAMSYESEYPDDYRVRISTTTTDTASFTTLFTVNAETGDMWQRHAIDLSAYSGQRVYFAFQLISDDMNMLLVDNIKILGTATIAGDEPPVGINAAENDVRLYPNPTTGKLSIVASNISSIEVIDAMGRVVMTQNGSANTMDISALAKGVYTLRVVSENGVSLKRVVKK
ncbi:MAG: choice-of-anchor J domain-containing protein [Bacteroidales bacterium]|nr:choice-of-anchor J domain-containing protein [Bacteroidales bacterium]